MSSWAVAGGKKMGTGDRELSEIGVCCKHLIDLGRARRLRALGYDTRLVLYVDAGVSPENTLLIATLPPTACDDAAGHQVSK
jgi:hypothetical protein